MTSLQSTASCSPRKFDSYVVGQIIKPILAVALIGLLVLMAARLVRLFPLLNDDSDAFVFMLKLIGYLTPHYFAAAMPLAICIGLLFGLSRLSRDKELVVMQSIGVSLARLSRPVILVSFLFSAFAIILLGWLTPHAYYASNAVMHKIINTAMVFTMQEGTFVKHGSKTYFVERIDRADRSFKRLFVFEDDGKGGFVTITAQVGKVELNAFRDANPLLVLQNANRLALTVENAKPGFEPKVKFSTDKFGTYRSHLDDRLPDYRKRGEMFSDSFKEMTFPELYRSLNSANQPQYMDALLAAFHKRIIQVISLPVLAIFAISFAIGHGRNRRYIRFGIALILLIGYVQLIEHGALATRVKGTSPVLTMWLPFLLFSAFSIWRYVLLCYSMRTDRLDQTIDFLADEVEKIKIFLAKQVQLRQAS